ncbi:Phenylalanyl-tRNA synthetase alpha chain [Fructilactobacillus florum 8D]|uniref:Phenylalanine--tRNA ligase alpha subunit n=1 Tax=Fructilactobacillus florum 8D TaxID=1221538 RepID=W9EGN1_9LACO|nr:phenylalanine--tRNA ligase subunit alpha [Fructilactobacillus florum]EKK20699.1 Phenylalanyl-tRNA synthetase alpha chain [Fructilactobacillus florum 2F]ETO40165.1 Phenylalanyl-tRNA synthetase alpha chain [Fructilactobacillus florum 8D]
MSLETDLEQIKQQGIEKIKEVTSEQQLNDLKVKFLGKKGQITQALREIVNLPAAERPAAGKLSNTVRDQLQSLITAKQQQLATAALDRKLVDEAIDVTLPGKNYPVGHPHVIQRIIDEIEDIFIGMGYQVLTGPEVEEERYNFEMMNLPKDHPARDMQDTFYITSEILMRTQTSPMQARTLEKHDFSKGPLKMISPGVVFRRDTDDPTHSHQFHQVEGIVIDHHITMADLKGTLAQMLKEMFGDRLEMRLRPSYFPFTEPSVEVDMTCMNCDGKGCLVCKGSGWIEVLGAGMVHPNVLKMAGVDNQEYGGFAFGVGPDRLAMLKYGVTDIRDFYLNNLKFLTQFD